MGKDEQGNCMYACMKACETSFFKLIFNECIAEIDEN